MKKIRLPLVAAPVDFGMSRERLGVVEFAETPRVDDLVELEDGRTVRVASVIHKPRGRREVIVQRVGRTVVDADLFFAHCDLG